MDEWQETAEVTVDDDTLRLWECRTPARTENAESDLVLVHGFWDSWESWRPLAQRLPDTRLWALDLPWRANGNPEWGRHGDACRWLEAGLSLLPRLPTLIVAHSFGATALLQLMARRGPGFPTPAALVAPVCRLRDAPTDPQFFAEALVGLRRMLAEGLTVRAGKRAARWSPELLRLMTQKVFEIVEPEGFLQFYTELSRLARASFERVATPVLLLGDENDYSAPPEDVAQLTKRLATITVRRDTGLGHFCHIEKPDHVATHITDFLRELRPLNEETEKRREEKVGNA